LAFLQQHGIVELESRGHQGTYLIAVQRYTLWKLIHPRDIVGAMPLPYSIRYEGLATALSEAFRQAEIALNLIYVRGAATRLRTLSEGRADFIVMSAFAVEEALKEGHDIKILLNLGTETYVSKHVLVFREHGHQEIRDGMRVGIDPQSLDQTHFIQRICAGKQVEMVEIGYMQLPVALRRGLIDATIWNQDELQRYSDLYIAPSEKIAGNQSNTEACIVTASNNSGLMFLMDGFLEIAKLQQIQQDVVSGSRIPRY
jgi:hypothetical protein